ncbi:MAG: hypothetical protein JSW53_03470 [Candidatus Bathyarchaeota archaeon]|nr:MAG: hypothetical protein JSW53_03470 [Candidatus Bathyarchaeota archaeon]
MLESLVTEVRSFYSLRELDESIDENVLQYKTILDDYSQWLGSLLRDSEENHGDEEWFKELQNSLKSGGKSKKKASSEWISLKGIMLSAEKRGEAEILFDAIEDINSKIDQLRNVKDSIETLKRSGLGKSTVYIVYIHNGVPEKISIRHDKGDEIAEKFKFAAHISASKKV